MLGSYRLSGEGVPGNLRLFSAIFLLLRGVEMVTWQRGGSAVLSVISDGKREHIWQWYLVAAMVLPVFSSPRDVCVLPEYGSSGVCRDLYGSGARAGFCGGEPHAAEHFICVPWNLVRADGGARHRRIAGAAHGRGGVATEIGQPLGKTGHFPQGKAGGRSD